MNAQKRKILDDDINLLLDDDVIEQCESDWGCNPVLVPKKQEK
jgi:hypothetical protein